MKPPILLIIKCLSFLLIVGGLLYGCGNTDKRSEEEEYIKRIKSRKIKEVEPLPEIKPYEPFTYTAYNLRSPFIPPVTQEPPKKMIAETGIHPDMNRRREVLESYPLDSLRMVGTIEKDKRLWALVIDPTGAVYRVTKGNYLGQNHGRIDSIASDKISLTEIVPDPSGGWRERNASMALIGTTVKSKEHSQKGKK